MDFRQAGHHVTLLDDEDGKTVTFPELHATVWGRGMVDHTPAYRPVAGAPDRTDDMWHIGMAHGLYVDYPETERSSLITPGEIEASGFDYLALGHVHLHRQMRHGGTLACYPGVPAASYGTRPTGSFAMVTLTPGRGAKVDARSIAPAPRRAAEAVC
jgi:DNA repair exonuclease SbcCD nuclease subunit